MIIRKNYVLITTSSIETLKTSDNNTIYDVDNNEKNIVISKIINQSSSNSAKIVSDNFYSIAYVDSNRA